ncbi:hypothetical protein FQN54_009232 [Arachnomyces sp. PD_36]|nr:hypothetical protein FQN54_009232 [Arachnomyces sp. PD_36]
MDADTAACKQSDAMFIVWMRHLDKHKTDELAARLAFQHLGREPVDAMHHSQGSFNRCYRVKFREGPDVLVRFPALGRSMFRREKLEDEVAVMEYITHNTSIPIPGVLGSGSSVVGPYMILEFVEGKLLSEYLRASQDPMVPSTLNLDINITTLRRAYHSMAEILLELYRCQFPAIGGLVRDDSGDWLVEKRAVTFNMNELVGLGNFPPKSLSQSFFPDATTYFVSLADDHLHHLETQRNDAVTDEDDCRKKYIARCLFRQVASKFSSTYNNGPFPLFCDDLRPSNVLVDEDLRVRAVIDWEFCYAAPAQFSHCSPWWLLLGRPDTWDAGFDDFLAHYMCRQKIFLEALRDRENGLAESRILPEPRLSELMAQSIENGNFWVFLAATSSFAFDDIYWQFIHPKHYGHFESTEDLMMLLCAEEQSNIEMFVQKKKQQMKEGNLDSHRTLEEMTNA